MIKNRQPDQADIEVIGYHARYRNKFEQLNRAWLDQYFTIEPADVEILANPEKVVIQPGGHIIFLKYQEEIIGTAALKYVDQETFELAKMAVDESFRGMGAGKLLCTAAIEKAKGEGAKWLVLYSVKSLVTAIAIYRKMGFQEITLEAGKYKRADIKMILDLDEWRK